MKLIIAGSRYINKYRAFYEAVSYLYYAEDSGFILNDFPKKNYITKVDEFVSGGCPTGPDRVPYLMNSAMDSYTEIIEFPADWKKHGKAAGPIRNREMAEYADALLLIWNGESRGSANMKKEMKKLGKPVYEIIL